MTVSMRITEQDNNPHLEFENALWESGMLWIAGIDEAGRGALAGPVVAAAVILPKMVDLNKMLSGVRDSKLMSANDRFKWADEIKAVAVSWAIELASAEEIDTIGIVPATRLASSRAVAQLNVCPECLLLDFLQLPDSPLAQVSLPKGDQCSMSIAAASVLAKTSRDSMLVKLDRQFPGYGFAKHKGYGTAEHLRALEKLGPSCYHRFSFAPLRLRCD